MWGRKMHSNLCKYFLFGEWRTDCLTNELELPMESSLAPTIFGVINNKHLYMQCCAPCKHPPWCNPVIYGCTKFVRIVSSFLKDRSLLMVSAEPIIRWLSLSILVSCQVCSFYNMRVKGQASLVHHIDPYCL